MKNNVLIFLLVLFLTACGNDDIEKIDGPACVIERINSIKKAPVRNPPAKVYSYTYNGATVYYIPSYCCDAFSELLDENCNLLCNPDGGLTGGGDGKCTDFFKNRSNEKLIWTDDRK